MPLKKSHRTLMISVVILGCAFFIPLSHPRIIGAVTEALVMLNDYAREHVLACLIPALFIAGAVVVFLNQQAVITYFGPNANKLAAYSVASVSGAILAVCSCTILPLFKGIYKKGAGLGPAVTLLYSGPAINILAIILSYKVFGWQLALARMIFSVVSAILIGMIMQLIFQREDEKRLTDERLFTRTSTEELSLGSASILIGSMVLFLIFLNWAPSGGANSFWDSIYRHKYWLAFAAVSVTVFTLVRWVKKELITAWLVSTRDLATQIFPLLIGGVLIAGFLLGAPNSEGLIPSAWITKLVGGNTLTANFFASIVGAFMYFATLTEIPIVQGLIGAGMGKGPALALLLAGPTLSLPSMLVIGKELGIKKTLVYVVLVISLSTCAGLMFTLLSA